MLGGRRDHLAGERGDGLAARLEECAELASEQARRLLARELAPAPAGSSPANARSTSSQARRRSSAGSAPRRRAPARQCAAEAEAEQQPRAAPSSTK